MDLPEGLVVVYCEGWDPRSRAVVDPLPVGVTRDRDRQGEQYAVVLAAGDRPVALVEVAWRQLFAATWLFDEVGRRTVRVEHRLLDDDRLFRLAADEWRYLPEHAEFDESAWHQEYRYQTTGSVEISFQPNGERGELKTQRLSWPGVAVSDWIGGMGRAHAEDPWRPRPRFGDWIALLDLDDTSVSLTEPEVSSLPVATDSTGPSSRPPTPLPPAEIKALFRTGARYSMESGEVSVEVTPAGRLTMPSGKLIIADPSSLSYDEQPLTVALEPGEYDVDVAVIRFRDEPTHRRVAAARLTARSEQVVSWELALGAGQDPRLLSDNEFFGFGVDVGVACFVDDAVSAGVATLVDENPDLLVKVDESVTLELTHPVEPANMIMFASGWGAGYYPAWVGRTADNAVACVVVETLVLRDATSLEDGRLVSDP